MTTAPLPPSPTFETWFHARHPEIPLRGATATLKLASEGATVPFMARYRKEQTGNLDEVAIRRVLVAKERWDQVLARQAFILETIERQGRLTAELRDRIRAPFDADELEDLYLPYKPKRQTKAAAAREAGLEPLADWIWRCGHGTLAPEPGQTLGIWAYTFRLWLAACSNSGTPAPPPAPMLDASLPPAEPVAQEFLAAWERADYNTMYSLVSSETQAKLSPEAFANRYTSAQSNATARFVRAQLRSALQEGEQLRASYHVEWDTARFGTLKSDYEMTLSLQDGQWRVNWEDGLVWPDLQDGGQFQVQYQIPRRANIYDREGKGLAVDGKIVTMQQMHGDNLIEVTDKKLKEAGAADAMVTAESGAISAC